MNATKKGLSFRGLVTGPRSIYEQVAKEGKPGMEALYRLNDLEHEWLRREYDDHWLALCEEKLGSNALNRIVVADRHVGAGFVSGGIQPGTVLADKCRNIENVRRYVSGLLDFFMQEFEEYRPSKVFCFTTASAPALAMAYVSDYLGLSFVDLRRVRIQNRYVIDTNAMGLMTPIVELYKRALGDSTLLRDLKSEGRAYIRDFRNNPSSPEDEVRKWNNHVKSLSFGNVMRESTRDVRRMIRSLKEGRGREADLRIPSHMEKIKFRFRKAISVSKNRRIFTPASECCRKEYVYFPLQVEPEASTMVKSPMTTNQIAVVEALAKSVPLQMNLVVKEHLPMLGRRPNGFYSELKKIPGVYLCAPWDDGFSLIKNSRMVCTITGTAGWEAIVLGKPALFLGYSPFAEIEDGCIWCSDTTELPEAVKGGLDLSPANDEKIELFMAAIIEKSLRFSPDLLRGRENPDVLRENREITRAIAKELLRV